MLKDPNIVPGRHLLFRSLILKGLQEVRLFTFSDDTFFLLRQKGFVLWAEGGFPSASRTAIGAQVALKS